MARNIAFFILISLILAGCTIPFIGKKYAALQVSSSPKADVYLDDEKVGETPFTSEKLLAKEYTVRLDPLEEGLPDWETKVTLYPTLTTAINYEFAPDKQASSGEVLALEALADSEAVEIAVVSTPDNASINLNDQPKGFTPLPIKSVAEGDHTLTVSAPGYKQRRIKIKAVKGYRLTVDVQLAKEPLLAEEATPSAQPIEEEGSKPTPTPTVSSASKPASPSAEIERPYVEIKDTPTGWLRVRSAPTTTEDNEIAKVNPRETYPYLGSNDTGWYQIRLPDGVEGWISGRYANLYK